MKVSTTVLMTATAAIIFFGCKGAPTPFEESPDPPPPPSIRETKTVLATPLAQYCNTAPTITGALVFSIDPGEMPKFLPETLWVNVSCPRAKNDGGGGLVITGVAFTTPGTKFDGVITVLEKHSVPVPQSTAMTINFPMEDDERRLVGVKKVDILVGYTGAQRTLVDSVKIWEVKLKYVR